jgi:hypothetical protein
MQSGIQARQLNADDADAIARVFHSRNKLMLRTKGERQRRLPEQIPRLLESGCEAYGTFFGEVLQAFSVFFPWRQLPFSTLVLMQSRPVDGPVNLTRNGLRHCLDAALRSLEGRGYTHTISRRILDAKWRPEFILKNAGRLGEYSYTIVEVIRAGAASQWERINGSVLDNQPVEHDTAIVIGAKPEAGVKADSL